jgi:hypothetical protein
MNVRYVPKSEDFENFTFEASFRLSDLLEGNLDVSLLTLDHEGDDHE